MNIFRILAAFIVIWLLVRMVKSYRERARLASRHRNRDRGTMVRCARCQLHIPETEAISKGNRYYCSREHADEDRPSEQAE